MIAFVFSFHVDTIRDVCERAGYYYWVFGPIGPWEGNGLTAAGKSGSTRYRGYMYWDFGHQLNDCVVASVSLRMVTENAQSGCYINVNKVGAYGPPSWDDCGDESYADNVLTPPSFGQEIIIPLNAQAVIDLQNAINGSKKFGVGISEGVSATGASYFHAHWAYTPYDAWLIVGCNSVETDETPLPGGLVRAVLYDASGRPVKDYGYVREDFVPEDMSDLRGGVYILVRGEKGLKLVR